MCYVTSQMERTLDIENWDRGRSGWKCRSGSHGHPAHLLGHGVKTLRRGHDVGSERGCSSSTRTAGL